jgi:competence protein ComGC
MKKISFILLLISLLLLIGVYYVSKQNRIKQIEVEYHLQRIENDSLLFELQKETKRIQDSIHIEQIKLLK